MHVPTLGAVHKSRICAWFSSATENVSADRMQRAIQPTCGGETKLARSDWNIAESEWTVQLGGDVAVLFDDTVHLGTILRMRRKAGKSWYNYLDPVDISQVKEDGLDLFFTLTWYQPAKKNKKNTGSLSADGKYKNGVADPKEVHVTCVICPISLTFDAETNTYSLGPDQRAVIDMAMKGEDVFEPPASV